MIHTEERRIFHFLSFRGTKRRRRVVEDFVRKISKASTKKTSLCVTEILPPYGRLNDTKGIFAKNTPSPVHTNKPKNDSPTHTHHLFNRFPLWSK